MISPFPVLAVVQAGGVWALHVPLFHVCPKSASCSCVCRGWSVRSWPFSGFPFLYGLHYLGLGLTWWWALLFSLSHPSSCYYLLPYHSIIPTAEFVLFQSSWIPLGLPFILPLMAQQDHWFLCYITSGLLCPICFPLGIPSPFAFLGLPQPFS